LLALGPVLDDIYEQALASALTLADLGLLQE